MTSGQNCRNRMNEETPEERLGGLLVWGTMGTMGFSVPGGGIFIVLIVPYGKNNVATMT